MRKILALSVIFLFAFTQAAFAQWGKGGPGPRFRGEFKPVVGAWSEYQMKGAGQEQTKMKMAVVGKEGSSYWYETVTDTPRGLSVMKMLVTGDPDDEKSVKRMIVKQGKEQAMEMPVMEGRPQPGSKPGSKGPAGKMIDKGMEKITVPAGTFTARHFQYQFDKDVVDSWISEKVSPYGIVKSKGRDFEMQLLGYGKGAKTQITETPKKFQMPKMPAGMPKGMMPPGMDLPPED
ncbi:MAG TPA: hypothetical protein PLT09_06030 [Deltaproteobacteria bacterium]|nr:hypothetical protein [Deltaproteobacteria bacterium]HPR56025.1 hypothetical protein [Deltaproteobacteria bacterium]HXK46978.1 hypothetical protein [Deltaproteobacteria bacterium]